MYFYITIKSIRGEDMTHALEKNPFGAVISKGGLETPEGHCEAECRSINARKTGKTPPAGRQRQHHITQL